MATYDEADQALIDAIKAVADLAARATNASTAAKAGGAATSLAEARAWLMNPNQAHGGQFRAE